MRGHITERGPGTWRVFFTAGYDESGKRKQRSFTVRGARRDAERELRRVLKELDDRVFVDTGKQTVGQYLEAWLESYCRHQDGAKTFEAKRNHFRAQIIPALGRILLRDLTPDDIQGAYSRWQTEGRKDGKGGLSAQTVIHFHRLLHQAFGQAVKSRVLVRNPCDAVTPPRRVRLPMKALDEAQTARLLAAARPRRLYLPILLAVATGARRGELLALRWEDVDLTAGTVTICRSLEQTAGKLGFKAPKTAQSRRVVPLPSFAVEALVKHKGEQAQEKLRLGPVYQDQGLVIARVDGVPVRPDRFSAQFGELIAGLDLPRIRFHDLRHSHATQLFRQGVHPKIVSERLGHSTIGITLDTYSHVLPGMQEQAVRGLDAALRKAMGEC